MTSRDVVHEIVSDWKGLDDIDGHFVGRDIIGTTALFLPAIHNNNGESPGAKRWYDDSLFKNLRCLLFDEGTVAGGTTCKAALLARGRMRAARCRRVRGHRHSLQREERVDLEFLESCLVQWRGVACRLSRPAVVGPTL